MARSPGRAVSTTSHVGAGALFGSAEIVIATDFPAVRLPDFGLTVNQSFADTPTDHVTGPPDAVRRTVWAPAPAPRSSVERDQVTAPEGVAVPGPAWGAAPDRGLIPGARGVAVADGVERALPEGFAASRVDGFVDGEVLGALEGFAVGVVPVGLVLFGVARGEVVDRGTSEGDAECGGYTVTR